MPRHGTGTPLSESRLGLCARVWGWDLLGWVCVPGRGVGTLLDGCVCQRVGLGPLRLQVSPQRDLCPVGVADPRRAACPSSHLGRGLLSLLLVSRRLMAKPGLGNTRDLWFLLCLHRGEQTRVSVHKCGKSTQCFSQCLFSGPWCWDRVPSWHVA